jgi:MscS family membrane protein
MTQTLKNLILYKIFDISVHQIIIALSIFVIFLILRQIFSRLLIMFLNIFGRKKGISIENQFVRSFETFSKLMLVILGLYFSINILALPSEMKLVFNRLIRSCVSFLIFWALYRSSSNLLQYIFKFGLRSEINLDSSLMLFFNNTLKLMICVFGVSVILQQWEYDFAALITGLGLGGLAFALAAKDTVANLFGSVMIMLDRPFSIGDWIITSKAEGRVESIGFRSTRVRTSDQALVTIPNSIISSEPITNMSCVELKKISFKLTFPGSIDSNSINEYTQNLREMFTNHTGIVPNTASVYFERFNGTNIEIGISFFIKIVSDHYTLMVQEDINMKIKILMESTGIKY